MRTCKLFRALWFWGPAVAAMALIHFVSARPLPGFVPPPIRHVDKLLHAAVYGVLAWLVARALWGSWRTAPSKVALAACLWSTALGGIEEIIQRFVPGRSGELGDAVANAAGAALAAALWWWAMRWLAHRREAASSAH